MLKHSLFEAPKLLRRGDVNLLKKSLISAFPKDQVSFNETILNAHGTDESFHPTMAPDAVFFPKSTEDVVHALKIAKISKSPVIPFGVGTSLEGHIAALQGGLSIDMSMYMNEIININNEDMDCRVQAGCTRNKLNLALKESGLFFPTDPGADATLGGMVSTRASGTNAVKYGTMRQNVLGVTCVLEDGRVIKTGSRARKSSAGLDLTALLVGSEGTLGCITEVDLRLYGQPECVATSVASFKSIHGAVSTVMNALLMGIPLARAELLDSKSINAVRDYASNIDTLTVQDQPCLFLEFHGTELAIKEQQDTLHSLAQDNDMIGEMLFANNTEDREKLWKARHASLYAVQHLRSQSKCLITDVCVPISHLADCITETAADIENIGVLGPLLGHIGDGNFHVLIPLSPSDSSEYREKVKQVNERMVKRALSYGGTCTGEHGIGYGKSKWLELEHGLEAVNTMKTIKMALDPDNRMNPGKWYES